MPARASHLPNRPNETLFLGIKDRRAASAENWHGVRRARGWRHRAGLTGRPAPHLRIIPLATEPSDAVADQDT